MSIQNSDTREEIELAVERYGDGELTAKERKEIVEVSASVEEAVNRARARLEGRRGEDESLTEGEDPINRQAFEVERAEQGDREHQAARLAESRGEDPGKAVKEAKKDAKAEGKGDLVT